LLKNVEVVNLAFKNGRIESILIGIEINQFKREG